MPGAAPLRSGSDVRASRRVNVRRNTRHVSVGHSCTTTLRSTTGRMRVKSLYHYILPGAGRVGVPLLAARNLRFFTNTRRAGPYLVSDRRQHKRVEEVLSGRARTLRTTIASRHVSRSLVRARSLSLAHTYRPPPPLRYLARSRNAAPTRRRDRRAPAAPPPVLTPTRTPLPSPAGPPHLSRPPRPRAPRRRYGAAPRRHSAPSAAARSPARPRPPPPEQTRRRE